MFLRHSGTASRAASASRAGRSLSDTTSVGKPASRSTSSTNRARSNRSVPVDGATRRRRYVADAGPLLERLHRLTRADVTTRNRRKARMLDAAYDDLEARIAALREAEELASIRPDLDGAQIMAELGVEPGPVVGEAYRFLLDLRMERGPLGEEPARQALRSWWAARGER